MPQMKETTATTKSTKASLSKTKDSKRFAVIDIASLPSTVTPSNLPHSFRQNFYQPHATYFDDSTKIPADSLSKACPMSLFGEIQAFFFYFCILGMPLAMVPITFALFFIYGFTAPPAYLYIVFLLTLAYYPIPEDDRDSWIKSNLLRNLYKYNSYKMVYPEALEAYIALKKNGVASGVPHGVFPIGALLSIPAINEYFGIDFRGGMASVVTRTPGLRYISSIGAIDVGRKSLIRHADVNRSVVGIVTDGINGIFAESDNHKIEAVAIEDKKGICKLALQLGADITVIHWFGNSKVLTPIVGKGGFFKRISRYLKVSIFFYVGRFYLPIPTRDSIVMCLGMPIIIPKKVKDPSDEEINTLHARVVEAHREVFERHKEAYGAGYEQKEFVVCK